MLQRLSTHEIFDRTAFTRHDVPPEPTIYEMIHETVIARSESILMEPPEDIYEQMNGELARMLAEEEKQKLLWHEQYKIVTAGAREKWKYRELIKIFMSLDIKKLTGFVKKNKEFFDELTIEEINSIIQIWEIPGRVSKRRRKFSLEVVTLFEELKKQIHE